MWFNTVLVVAGLCLAAKALHQHSAELAGEIPEVDTEKAFHDYIRTELRPLEDSMQCIKDSILKVQRQLLDHQVSIEEKARTDGMSGIKQSRVEFGGTKSYFRESYKGKRFAAVHSHANFERTVGLGEFAAVLHGVQFNTRHNDYDLRKPIFNNSTFLSTEEIPFPPVPTSVTKLKGDIPAQIEEMRRYFLAWKNDDKTVDYKPYFRPVLVYMEGWWTEDSHTMNDFKSARHNFNGKTWEDMWQKFRFSAESGRKGSAENIAYLPTKLYNPNGCSDTSDMDICDVQVAQWNYRILGWPLRDHIPLNRFRRVKDDMASTMTRLRKSKKYDEHPSARFQLNPDNEEWKTDMKEKDVDYTDLLDRLFVQVPGLSNGGSRPDNAFNVPTLRSNDISNPLNPFRYHRKFKVKAKGAMGSNDRFRFYNDDQLFMAMNTQDKVANVCLNNSCRKGSRGCADADVCVCQRWSYAVPVEIIYLTPLNSWNPYDLEFHLTEAGEKKKTGIPHGGVSRKRNGHVKDRSRAYNGTDIEHYYRTPSEFYNDFEVVDKADTSNEREIGVLDRAGKIRKVAPSGIFPVLPDIPGVGRIRQRYPILPVHIEGGGLGKELRALQDIVLEWKTNQDLYREELNCQTDSKK